MISFIGVIFGGAGFGMMMTDDAPLFMAIIFSLVGSGMFLAGIYSLAKSLKVSVTKNEISSRRFLFGYPITTKTIAKDSIRSIDIKKVSTTNTDNKTTVFYEIKVKGEGTQNIVVGERLNKRSEAEMLKKTYEMYAGVRSS